MTVQDNSEVKLGLDWSLIVDGDDEVEFVVPIFLTLDRRSPIGWRKSWRFFELLAKAITNFFLTSDQPRHYTTPHPTYEKKEDGIMRIEVWNSRSTGMYSYRKNRC